MSACVVEPLERLADEVRAFVLRPELRSLHVAADAHLSSGALRVVLAGEHLADNLAPWLAVEADTHHGAAWEQIEARLVAEHQTRREAGTPLEPLPPDVPGALGPARCAARMRQCSASVKEPARGLVVVLLCKGTSVSEAWLLRLTEMLGDPALGNVRIVVFTARPGRIKAMVEVDMPRPRDPRSPEYHSLHDQLVDLLADEVDRAFAQQERARK